MTVDNRTRATHRQGKSQENSVLEQNIDGGQRVSDFIVSTLGPYGNDKLLYNLKKDQKEYVEVSNEGAYLLKRVTFDHPAAKMIVHTAASQEDRIGDGTTTTAVYAGEMLRRSKPLLEKGIHPVSIIRGLDLALDHALEKLNESSVVVTPEDKSILVDIAQTSLSGQLSDQIEGRLSEWVVDAVLTIAEETDRGITVDPGRVQTESLRSGTLKDTRFIQGMVLKKSFAGQYQPNSLEQASIALVTQPFTRQSVLKERFTSDRHGSDQSVSYDAGDDVYSFHDREIELVASRVDPLVEADVDVVFVEGRVEDTLLPYFDREKIAVVRNARIDRMELIADATGASIATHLDEFEEEDCGVAGSVEYQTLGDQDILIFEDGAQNDAVSLLIRGSTWMSGWEVDRNVMNAVRAVGTALECGTVVPGGGAIEMTLANHLRYAATECGGRESLALETVADTLEMIPWSLARNAGMDSQTTLAALRAAQSNGDTEIGVLGGDLETGDVFEQGIVEPVQLKENALSMAVSTVKTILRIDDVVTGISAEAKYKNN